MRSRNLTSLFVSALLTVASHVDAKLVGTAHYRDYFYVGQQYTTQGSSQVAYGQIYVEHLTPASGVHHKYPLLFIHGAGMTGSNFLNTPDGRVGWADYFMSQGYEIYIIDQPSRGRSPWQQNVDGPQGMIDAASVEARFTAPKYHKSWPAAKLHTQWPGSGRVGDPTFDKFYASMVPLLVTDSESGKKNQAALTELLKMLPKPVIMITHSQSGLFGWPAADAVPRQVKGIVAIEPGGPPFKGDTFNPTAKMHPWGLSEVPMNFSPPITDPKQFSLVKASGEPGYTCMLQKEPAHKWVNLRRIPALVVTGEASWHATFDDCTVRFIRQAGVKVDYVRLEEVGIHGNGHMLFMEKNNLVIAKKVILPWINKL